jgi:phosphoserine phosphatase
MKSVVTVIAVPGKEKLTQALVNDIAGVIAKAGGITLGNAWLAEDIACDIFFSRLEHEMAENAVRGLFGGLPFDCAAQDVAARQKRLLVSDMDSTIITIECIDEIADFAGVKPQVAAITGRAMCGEIDFAAALAERVALLEGLNEAVLQRVYGERVRFMPGARALVATMRAHGAYTMLVSGGFDFFTARVQAALAFDAHSANRLETSGGRLTGHVIPPVLDRQAKLQSLMETASRLNIRISEALAVGDGANDLPMLTAAGLGVAYHAKPVVRQAARARIDYADLTALLYMQGYKKEEFVGRDSE